MNRILNIACIYSKTAWQAVSARSALTALLLAFSVALNAADEGGTWLAHYDGKSLHAASWPAIRKPNTKLEDGTANREISPGRMLYMHDGQIPDTLARINLL